MDREGGCHAKNDRFNRNPSIHLLYFSVLIARADEDSAPFILLAPMRIGLHSSYSRRRGFGSVLITRADEDSAPFFLLAPTRIQFHSYYSCRPGFGSVLITRADENSVPFLLFVPTRIRLHSCYSRRPGFGSVLITRADEDSAPFFLLVPTRIRLRFSCSCQPGFGSNLVTRADQHSAPFLLLVPTRIRLRSYNSCRPGFRLSIQPTYSPRKTAGRGRSGFVQIDQSGLSRRNNYINYLCLHFWIHFTFFTWYLLRTFSGMFCVTDIAFYVLQKLTDFLAKQNHDLLQSAREYS